MGQLWISSVPKSTELSWGTEIRLFGVRGATEVPQCEVVCWMESRPESSNSYLAAALCLPLFHLAPSPGLKKPNLPGAHCTSGREMQRVYSFENNSGSVLQFAKSSGLGTHDKGINLSWNNAHANIPLHIKGVGVRKLCPGQKRNWLPQGSKNLSREASCWH